jgi:hypothetical protein
MTKSEMVAALRAVADALEAAPAPGDVDWRKDYFGYDVYADILEAT